MKEAGPPGPSGGGPPGGLPGSLLCSLEGAQLTAAERELLRHPRAGGVVLFERNFHDLAQLAELTSELRALREPPLLVTVDQEGGRVQRLHGEFTTLPEPAALGRLYQRDGARALEAARAVGWLMAAELRAAGIDLSFAPLLDLDRGYGGVLAGRAFSASPEEVAALAKAWIEGARCAGMAAVVKHFPGHGGVKEDSHHVLPQDPRPRAALERDLFPFRAVFPTGVEAVMAAHVCYTALDARRPAGFSPVVLGDLLRVELAFEGLIFSDDLTMAGACTVGTPAQRTRAARVAGCDLLLLCHDAGAAWESLRTLAAEQPGGERRGAARITALYGRSAPSWRELRISAQWRTARAWCDRLGAA